MKELQTPIIGEVAITPHLAEIPAFTDTDVRAYIYKAGYSRGRREITRGDLTIKSISFMTTEQLKDMIGVLMHLERENNLVCFVELAGDFLFVSPTRHLPLQFQRAYQVYDARSGNLLSHGAIPENLPGASSRLQRASETEFLHALGFTDDEIAASRERVKHLFPQP